MDDIEKNEKRLQEKMNQEVDPITFSDEKIYGLDPAVHWVHLRGQREQFPEVVKDIAEHWNDAEWLTKLVERLGYNTLPYHAENNPLGINTALEIKRNTHKKIPRQGEIRLFLLRAAKVKSSVIGNMFSAHSAPRYDVQRMTAQIAQVAVKREAVKNRK